MNLGLLITNLGEVSFDPIYLNLVVVVGHKPFCLLAILESTRALLEVEGLLPRVVRLLNQYLHWVEFCNGPGEELVDRWELRVLNASCWQALIVDR